MVIGTLALTGFPLTAGYFSKDAIIESADVSANPMAAYGFIMTLGAAALTAFYSWRLIFMTFHGEPHDREHYEHAHESPLVMLVPLGLLAIGSLAAGYPCSRCSPATAPTNFFRESLTLGTATHARGKQKLPLLVTCRRP